MKKILSILSIAILMISMLPFALAREGNDDQVLDADIEAKVDVDVKHDNETVETEENDDNGSDDANDDNNAMGQNGKGKGMPEIRDELKLKVLESREKYLKRRIELRSEFSDVRKDVRDACKADKESQACKDAEASALASGKEVLTNAADEAIAHLVNIKDRLDDDVKMDADAKAKIVADIDASIAKLEAAKDDVAAATNQDELRAAAQEIKDAWKGIKRRAMVHAGFAMYARMGVVLARFENLETKAECAVDAMKADGKDTAQIEATLAAYKKDVDAANASYAKVKADVEAAEKLDPESDQDEIASLLADVKVNMNATYKSLRDAHKEVISAYVAVKSSGVDVSACKLGVNVNNTVQVQ